MASHNEKVLLLVDSLPLLSYNHRLLNAIPGPLFPVGEGVGGPKLDMLDSFKGELLASGDGDPKLLRPAGEGDLRLCFCPFSLLPLAIAFCSSGLVEGEKDFPPE